MRTSRILKILETILSFLFITLILCLPFYLIATIMRVSDLEHSNDIVQFVNFTFPTSANFAIISFVYFSHLALFTLNIYLIFLLRNVIKTFKTASFFDLKIIKNFKIIGVLSLVTFFIYEVITTFEIGTLTLASNGYFNLSKSPVNGLIFGLFFLILSKIFEIGRTQKEENIELKQENELTI